ncbi:hypothetical protein EUX98_g7974 [Antrodiella citrinella]|uniref:F-box domain-containing protein n=1 Tax=Antrodiella citrinella TaxID=2447956 RepID=A0A4S4MCJ2_9APHY|nr:hypothetical protein EUX98_g7974 [Antrodiella citrinella]
MEVPLFPNEIIDAIGDVASPDDPEDRKTLIIMTAVCRAWASVAKEKLWRKISVEHKKVPDLIKFLQDAARGTNGYSVGSCVRWMDFGKQDNLVDSPVSSMPLTMLMTLLDLLPNVEVLRFYGMPYMPVESLVDSGGVASSSLCRGGPTVKQIYVDFHGGQEYRMAQLAVFVNSFTDIGDLHVRGLRFQPEHINLWSWAEIRAAQKSLGELGIVRANVRGLTISFSSSYSRMALMELMRQSPCLQLESIGEGIDDFIVLSDLDHKSGSSVKHLSFDMPQDIEYGPAAARIWTQSAKKYSARTSLREVFVYVLSSALSDLPEWHQTLGLFSHIPSRHLTLVRLSLSGSARNFSMQLNGESEKLANIFCKMPCLRTLELYPAFFDMAQTPPFVEQESEEVQSVIEGFKKVLPGISVVVLEHSDLK